MATIAIKHTVKRVKRLMGLMGTPLGKGYGGNVILVPQNLIKNRAVRFIAACLKDERRRRGSPGGWAGGPCLAFETWDAMIANCHPPSKDTNKEDR
jgi:hypothetical protein